MEFLIMFGSYFTIGSFFIFLSLKWDRLGELVDYNGHDVGPLVGVLFLWPLIAVTTIAIVLSNVIKWWVRLIVAFSQKDDKFTRVR